MEDESISGEYGCSYHDHYVLNATTGMPYLVDLHTMRYYLATHDNSRGSYSNYQPVDRYGDLVDKASPCQMTVSMTVGNVFSLRVTTKPLAAPIVPYKMLPSDCLDNTESGPEKGTIIKVLKYIPDGLVPGSEYVDCYGIDVDIYMGSIGPTPALQGKYGDKPRVYELFKRESRYPEFYESLDMTTILALQRGMK